ncbi:MAG: hypothetical protein GIW94_13180 [Candidatus Eremiobacteraeota bacterium]|nr:hypothetical protein [Candidatus Eremiobacteraeota bacterium]
MRSVVDWLSRRPPLDEQLQDALDAAVLPAPAPVSALLSVPLPWMIVMFVWLLPTPDATLTPALPEAALSTLPVRIAVGLMVMTPEAPELF